MVAIEVASEAGEVVIVEEAASEADVVVVEIEVAAEDLEVHDCARDPFGQTNTDIYRWLRRPRRTWWCTRRRQRSTTRTRRTERWSWWRIWRKGRPESHNSTL